jgi:sugar/nucleoside kinase (ribokinase family)
MHSVLVVGGVSWDTIIALDRFPEPRPQTLFARGARETLGSTGAGKALNLRRLGFDVTLHAMVGDDEPGRRIEQRLSAAGVHFIGERDPQGTERHLNLMAGDGGRISIYVAPASFDPAFDRARLESLIPRSDHFVLNILNYCRQLIPAARSAKKPIWCDVHDWDGRNDYHRDFVEAADYLFLSSDKLPDFRAFMERAVRGKQLVVCTHGSRGATALTAEGRWIETPIAPGFAARDTNGAGDAFFSGVLLGHARGEPWERALQLGAIAAGYCVAADELAHPELSEAALDQAWQRLYG